MIVEGLRRPGSTILSRSWPSVHRDPAPARGGARLPWKRSSGNGPLWHSRHRPTWRLATIARPLAGSPLLPVREPGVESSPRAAPAAQQTATIPAGITIRRFTAPRRNERTRARADRRNPLLGTLGGGLDGPLRASSEHLAGDGPEPGRGKRGLGRARGARR